MLRAECVERSFIWSAALALAALGAGCSCAGTQRAQDTGVVVDGGGLGDDGGVRHDTNEPPRDLGAVDGGSSAPDLGTEDARTVDAGTSGAPARIEIYSGDGLMMPQGFPGGDLMKVIVLDASGAPVPGTMVTWTVTSGGAAVTGEGFSTGPSGTTLTDAHGIARAGVRGEFGSMMTSALPSTIRATIATGGVDFHVFCSYTPPGMTPSLPLASITTPEGRAFDATARGTTIVGGLVVNISNTNGSERGRGLEGIGVRFLPTSDPTSDDPPIVTCANATVGVRAGGTVYSDAGGIATCDVRVPDAPGDYYLAIRVGGAIDFTPFTLHVM